MSPNGENASQGAVDSWATDPKADISAPESPIVRPMAESDAEPVANLVGLAMNPDEGDQARITLDFHFACRRHGLDDGRTYYVLEDNDAISGVVGLHFYHWGPAENVWLAWFAIDPNLRGMGLGKLLMDCTSSANLRQLVG